MREGSTITQWKALAEAFSHKPTLLCYDDNGTVSHNGIEKGYLYVINEPIRIGIDIYQHPRTTMDANAEFLTSRPLKVKMIAELWEVFKDSDLSYQVFYQQFYICIKITKNIEPVCGSGNFLTETYI